MVINLSSTLHHSFLRLWKSCLPRRGGEMLFRLLFLTISTNAALERLLTCYRGRPSRGSWSCPMGSCFHFRTCCQFAKTSGTVPSLPGLSCRKFLIILISSISRQYKDRRVFRHVCYSKGVALQPKSSMIDLRKHLRALCGARASRLSGPCQNIWSFQ